MININRVNHTTPTEPVHVKTRPQLHEREDTVTERKHTRRGKRLLNTRRESGYYLETLHT